ncbi:MAG TPA: MarR family transcriptional regulator [Micromonosporaceae bacterium]
MDDKLRRYTEEIGVWASRQGMPPAYGRLLAWLLICDPPQQTSAELAEALGLSKGFVSSGMRMLERSGLVRRVAITGQRGHAYEMLPDALTRGTTDAVPNWRAMAALMRRGIDLVGPDAAASDRLRITAEYFDYIADKIPPLIEDFKRQKNL